jgi:diacylglycerol kinase (ATP)
MTTAEELCAALAERGRKTSLEVFSDLESLQEWAATDDRPFAALVCVGGDGTLSAAAPAAVRRSVPFLPVSSGFGNLFARAFQLPATAAGVLDLLTHGRVVHADVGMRNDGELFLCHQTYGLISDVQEAVEATAAAPRARWQRWLAYYRAAIDHLRRTAPPRLRVSVDGRVVAVDAALVVVANVATYGPWLPVASDASPVDGLFDVFVMKGGTNREIVGQLLRRHLRLPGAQSGTLLRGSRVSVWGLGARREQLEVLRGRLPVVVSAQIAAALEQGRESRKAEGSSPLHRVA